MASLLTRMIRARVEAAIILAPCVRRPSLRNIRRGKWTLSSGGFCRKMRNPNIATIVGVLEHIRGLTHNDVQAFQRATQILEDSPRRFMVADALSDYGEELLSRGRRVAAVAVLEQAMDRMTILGAQCDVERIARLLHSAGGRKSRLKGSASKPLTGWSSLTRTEQRVARLIAAGHTNRSAARELALSANTIATHLRAIFGKLGVNSRVQLTLALMALAPAQPEG